MEGRLLIGLGKLDVQGWAITLNILPHTGKIPKLLEGLKFLLYCVRLDFLASLPVVLAALTDIALKLGYAQGSDRNPPAQDSDEVARMGLLGSNRRILLGSFGKFEKVILLDLLQRHVRDKFGFRDLLPPRNDEVEGFIEGDPIGNRQIALLQSP